MIWKRYQNELIVGFAFLLLLISMGYKSMQTSARTEMAESMQSSVSEFKELLVLQKRWANKQTSKKVDKLRTLAPAAKVVWQKKGKKLSVSYKGLDAKELNKIVTSILNLPVQLEHISLVNQNGKYNLELKCKW